MPTFDDIIESAKLPQTTVRICLRGDLLAEHQALEAELKSMPEWVKSNLAESDPRVPIAQQLRDIEEQMREAETPFTFRALGRRKYRELVDAHPGEGTDRWNGDTFPRALISECCIEPRMTPADVDRLFDLLNEGACETVFMAAYSVNEGVSRVPFSEAASKITRRLEPSS